MGPRLRYSAGQWSALAASVLLVLAPAVGTGVAVAGGGPATVVADSGPASDTAVQRAPAFLGNRTVESRGDVATVTVDFTNSTEAALRVGPGDDTASDFSAAIAVEDRDGDGRVAVRLNTYTLGREEGAVTTRGDDNADVRRSSSLNAPLRAGNYSLTLLVGNETVDESTLVLESASVDGLALRVANRSVSDRLSSPAVVRAAVENGTVHESDKLFLSGTLLVELEASGLSGALASQSGPNATARFLTLLKEPGFSLTVRENGSTIEQEEEGNAFSLTPDGTAVVPDPTDDTYYVLLDLPRLQRYTYTDPGDRGGVEAGDLYDVNVTVSPESRLFERRQSVESRVTVRRGEVTVDVPIEVASGPNQTVEATTTLPVGATVSVLVEDTDDSFRAGQTVTVGESGRIVATFDLTNRTVGDRLHLTIGPGDAADPLVLYFEYNAVRVTERGTPTATRTPSPPISTPTPSENPPTTTETTPTDDSSGSIPGFGMVGALLAGAVAAAITAFRRSR